MLIIFWDVTSFIYFVQASPDNLNVDKMNLSSSTSEKPVAQETNEDPNGTLLINK